MADVLEQQVKDIEDLIADIPHMLNLRLEGITAAQNETSARIALLDKQMSMVLRDLRDLRGGVTRQLVAQDERLSKMESHLGERLGGMESHLGERLGKMESQLGAIEVTLQEVVRRLPGG
jgi:hypothetical protein